MYDETVGTEQVAFAGWSKAFLFSSFMGFLGCLIGILAGAMLIPSSSTPGNLVFPVSLIATGIGGLFSGFSAARALRRRGMLMGIVAGLILYAILTLLSLWFSDAAPSFLMLIKLAICVGAGAVGGIFGINFRMRRKK